MKRYDVAIIGTGPAGLEAALTLKNRNTDFIIFGNPYLSDKVSKAHEVRNYLGLPFINGNDMQKAFIDHINMMNINITNDYIKQVFSLGDYFSLQGEKGEMYEANTVIISSGVKVGNKYKNEDKYLGMGISYCATCDAMLYKNKNIACIIESKDEYDEAIFLSSVVNHIYLFPLFKDNFELKQNMDIINDDIIGFLGDKKANKIILKNGEYDVDGIFILRKSVPPSYLIPGIELDGAHIKTNKNMETNILGLFAAGDITGTPYQYIKAAGEGNVAALAAVNYLVKRGK